MARSNSGFTMVELVIAILIGGILIGISVTSFSAVQARFAAKGALTTYETLHYRARAQAIEFGEDVSVHLDATGDSAWIEHNGSVLESVRFGDVGVDTRIFPASVTSYKLCFSARGYTDTSCNSTNGILRLQFAQNADSVALWVFPFGQLVGS